MKFVTGRRHWESPQKCGGRSPPHFSGPSRAPGAGQTSKTHPKKSGQTAFRHPDTYVLSRAWALQCGVRQMISAPSCSYAGRSAQTKNKYNIYFYIYGLQVPRRTISLRFFSIATQPRGGQRGRLDKLGENWDDLTRNPASVGPDAVAHWRKPARCDREILPNHRSGYQKAV